MEQKNNVLIAGVALGALVVGVFVGFMMQGNGQMQGKLSLLNEKGAKQCENYKSLHYQGQLTQTLGSSKKVEDAINNCQKNYSAYWNASPTAKECMSLKNRLDSYGVTVFSSFLKKSKIANSNAIFCGQNYPFMWYGPGVSVSANECWAYKMFVDSNSLTSFLNNDKNKAAKVIDTCKQKVVGWAPAIPGLDIATCKAYKDYLDQGTLSQMIADGKADAQVTFSCATNYPDMWYKTSGVNISAYTCVEYKKYFDLGVLTDLVNVGNLDGNIAPQCDTFYKYIWNGVTHAECYDFATWYKQGVLTPNIGGNANKAVDAVEACKYYGYGNLFL